MSSSEDSETAEWEREQMLRGTQSRVQTVDRNKTNKGTHQIDATVARSLVNQDIERGEASIESLKKNIGMTRLEIGKSEKKIEAIKKCIERLESANPLFEKLLSLDDPDEIIQVLKKYKSVITKLPHDQKEMIDLLEEKARAQSAQPTMEVDQ